jgi:hypothetical protein
MKKFYSQLPTLRLVLHVDYLVSVNAMYKYGPHGVYKTGDAYRLQELISNQIRSAVDLKNYPWLNNDNWFSADYKFMLKSNFGNRDTSNLIKVVEDGICPSLGINDNRMIKVTSQKFDNANLIEELIICTITPYVGSHDIFKLMNDDELNSVNKTKSDLLNYYSKIIELLKQYYKNEDLSDKELYIAKTELDNLVGAIDVPMCVNALNNLGVNLKVVSPKRVKYIRMESPSGDVCEMYDHEIQDRFNEGYSFKDYNYII